MDVLGFEDVGRGVQVTNCLTFQEVELPNQVRGNPSTLYHIILTCWGPTRAQVASKLKDLRQFKRRDTI